MALNFEVTITIARTLALNTTKTRTTDVLTHSHREIAAALERELIGKRENGWFVAAKKNWARCVWGRVCAVAIVGFVGEYAVFVFARVGGGALPKHTR